MIAIGVVIDGVEDAESFLGQVFGGRNAVENDGLVVGQAVEEIEYRGIARIDQEGVTQRATTCSCASALMSEKSITMPLAGSPGRSMMSPESVTSRA